MSDQFLILALPRSRTKWLSTFLSYGDWFCGHDELLKIRQLEDVQSWLSQSSTGSIETCAAPFWRLGLHLNPNLKIVTIRRDPVECAISSVKAGLSDDVELTTKYFKYLDKKLDQIEKRTGCRSYHFDDLNSEEICKDLFEYLLPYKHDHDWWSLMAPFNIQVNGPALKRYVTAYTPQINRLQTIARQKSLALLSTARINHSKDIELEFTSLRTLLTNGQNVMEQHCAEVGENSENYLNKNLELLYKLDQAGCLQVTVAKSNGKIFGYLVTIISESLEVPGRLAGCHTAFYGSPDYPGVGLKLQRKALEGLRSRNVFEVIMRAGIRGAGDRTASLYKRIGAEPFGTYYRLELENI